MDNVRRLFGAIPAAVSIVTTVDSGGVPYGFTANTLSAVSLDPPLISVCVQKGSRTLKAIGASGAFAVNVLADGGQRAARLFASRAEHRFAKVRWSPSTVAGGAPLLEDVALAHAECVVERFIEAGDHWLVIGRLERVDVTARAPLLYQRGVFAAWSGLAVRQSTVELDHLPESELHVRHLQWDAS
jgi:flavin-dependent trigonelline monooxygenase, reductase component